MENNNNDIKKIIDEIKSTAQNIFLEHEGNINKAHGWDHVMRVYGAALKIASFEKNVNLNEVIIAVLLHDIGRYKESSEIKHAEWSYRLSTPILTKLKDPLSVQNIDIDKILRIIRGHSGVKCEDEVVNTIEYKIVVDADLIDSFGPIGILRAPLDPRFETIEDQVKHISDKADMGNYVLKTSGGIEIGGSYKKYLHEFYEQYRKQVNDFGKEN